MRLQRSVQLLHGLARHLAGGSNPCKLLQAAQVGMLDHAGSTSTWHGMAKQHASMMHTSAATCISASPSQRNEDDDSSKSSSSHPYFPRISSENPYQV